ncbi:MAG TPA: AAA family ATPase [Blastocatellia bacterium]
MIRRIYINNFRCLENFELSVSGQSSVLLIGKNGAGKTTVGLALEILQNIAREPLSGGTNRVGELVKENAFYLGHSSAPMRFEIEVELDGRIYIYSVAFELPPAFKELRVFDESFVVDGKALYTRELAQVRLARTGQENEAHFRIDWHLVALPIIQEQSTNDPLFIFKQWLARMLILRPIPALIRGNSDRETLQPSPTVADFGAWFSGLLALAPGAYSKIEEYLRLVMPDFKDIKNPLVAKDARNLVVQFSNGPASVPLDFQVLSDGEKCFMICAMVLAANDAYGPLLCFWDEPDNYLSLDEVGHLLIALRKIFKDSGQLIATSHNPEAIRRFSRENTYLLHRKNHLEPTIIRQLSEIPVNGDLINALIRGDIEP